MSVFRVRKVAFINFGLLLIFLASWISWYIYPVARSITKEFSTEYGFAAAEFEDHVFYGKVPADAPGPQGSCGSHGKGAHPCR